MISLLIIEDIPIRVTQRNIEWLKNQGCIDKSAKKGFDTVIKTNNLQEGSHTMVKVLCDYCLEDGIETVVKKRYETYIKQNKKSVIKKDCCKKCSPRKLKESNLRQYGVENSGQREDVKNSIKKLETTSRTYTEIVLEDWRYVNE